MNSNSDDRCRSFGRLGDRQRRQVLGFLTLSLLTIFSLGCAKGALWRLGYLSPQARQQWADEEKIAKSWPTIRGEMTALVDQAKVSSPADQQRVAARLTEMIQKDDRVLVRLHAAQLLGELSPDVAMSGALAATKDREADVRVAACRVFGKMKTDDALTQLSNVMQRDEQPDVQIAAVRAMSHFRSPRAAQLLRFALESEQPALQLAAADSLQSITGQKFGRDIPKWQEHVASLGPTENSTLDGSVNRASHQQPDEIRSFLESIKR